MTANQLRKMGFVVLFRDGYAIASETPLAALRLPINNGEWMEKAEDINAWEIFTPSRMQRLELVAVAKMCYCQQLPNGNSCDFCTGGRRLAVEQEIELGTGLVHVDLPCWGKEHECSSQATLSLAS
jgi:hypothetical protein